MDTSHKPSLALAATIIGVSLIATGAIVASYFYRVKALNDVINITGSASKTITSDVVKWRLNFSRTVDEANLKQGYALLKSDNEAVMKYLAGRQIPADKINVSPVNVNQQYDAYQEKMGGSAPKRYMLSQEVTIESNEVDKVTQASKESSSLISEGVFINTVGLEYYYSKLADLKMQMLSEATKNAKDRAQQIAQSTGAKIGYLRSANMGVTQITQVNSTEVSDYGMYDTSSIEKQITAIVRATFSLK
jgi:hypothetical protein